MNPLLLFDVDGTIAVSGQKIDAKISTILEKLHYDYDLGIVGGGNYEKIMDQINNSKIFTHIFAECGCVYYKLDENKNYNLIYKKNIRSHPLYNKINQLVKVALRFLSNVDYIISGNFIDLRNGIIYISLIGMSATNEERKYFMELDKEHSIRSTLIQLLQKKSVELNIDDNIKILEGGSVGVGIYPIEHGKSQVMDFLQEYENISYFGDKYTVDGNDYELLNHERVKGYPVNSTRETLNVLKKINVEV